jgi:hypothetical protein
LLEMRSMGSYLIIRKNKRANRVVKR